MERYQVLLERSHPGKENRSEKESEGGRDKERGVRERTTIEKRRERGESSDRQNEKILCQTQTAGVPEAYKIV